MILSLVYFGNPLLRSRSLAITEITPEIKQLAYDMIETMDANKGVGLAAIQVGKPLRMFVIRPEIENEGEVVLGEAKVFINPILLNPSQEREILSEGCLSIPGLHVEVERPKNIHIKALNLDGKQILLEFNGFSAREIMHENDHLNAVLFIDRVPAQKRKEISPLLKQIQEKYN
jgi:peptide deformylase